MLSLSQWEQDIFSRAQALPELTAIFPSREIFFSPSLLARLHLSESASPKTLDQWYELCSPEDHSAISQLERAISGRENFVSVTRKLYCGDGVFRSFRLEAFIIRDNRSKPVKMFGREVSSLSAWLEEAEDGDTIEYGAHVLEAVEMGGVKVLRDAGEIEDMHEENLRLRREIQKRIFSPLPSSVREYEDSGSDTFLRNTLEENISLALNVLTGNSYLKALKQSLSEPSLTVGICGLTGSGKTSLMNALLGEKLISAGARNSSGIPVLCREGETRGATVHYQDGRTESVRGQKLTRSFMKKLAAIPGVVRIDVVMPGALIPRGICFIDTPGYDSLAGSGEAVLRNILPELDMILYVTPIRSGLKGSDREYIRLLMNANGRMIFVLSQTDLESGDTEAGRMVRSAEAKIAGTIEAVREELLKLCGRDFDIVPVSSRNALDKFYDRNSPLWTSSNIEGLIECLPSSPAERALVYRTERTLKLLDAALAGKTLKGSPRWRLQEYAGNLRKLLLGREEKEELHSFPLSVHQSEETGKNILSSLITSLREHDFRNRFFSLAAFGHERRVLLLGADRSQSLKLLARLAHNLAFEVLPEGRVSSREWLCSGHSVPFECISLPVIQSGETFLVAPSDSEMHGHINWHGLMKRFTPVVSVDLARIDSGLSDLSRSPYLTGLALNDWVLAFGNAGLFASRQKELVSQVPARVKEFVDASGLKSPGWFIFENYRIF